MVPKKNIKDTPHHDSLTVGSLLGRRVGLDVGGGGGGGGSASCTWFMSSRVACCNVKVPPSSLAVVQFCKGSHVREEQHAWAVRYKVTLLFGTSSHSGPLSQCFEQTDADANHLFV